MPLIVLSVNYGLRTSLDAPKMGVFLLSLLRKACQGAEIKLPLNKLYQNEFGR